MKKIKLGVWLISIITLFLAGCSGTDTENGSTIDGEELAEGINITAFNQTSTGSATTSIPVNDTATVEVKLLTSTLIPLEGEIVEVEVQVGTASTPALTDANGETSFSISPPTDLTSGTQTGVLTITSGDYSKTVSYEFVASSSGSGGGDSSEYAAIEFLSAEPQYLSLKGTGGQGLGEQSKVTFKLVDNNGSAVEGATLHFRLTSDLGGLTLSSETGTTNESGEAFTYVQSGTVPTTVRVTAYVTTSDAQTVSAQSDLLGVATGIPDQDSFTLSLDKIAPQGLNYDGEEVVVTARVADRNNNPVPEGTAVYFTTEGGSIESLCQTDVSGACSVTWISQNPKPSDHRVTIEAYLIGNESYYDREGGENGIFDGNDIFDDLPESFRDDDENGVYSPDATAGFVHDFARDEQWQDYNGDLVYSSGDGVFNGVPCNHATDCPTDANNIANRSRLQTNIRASAILIMAADRPNIEIYEITSGDSCLDTNGKIDTTSCTDVANSTISFTTGSETKRFWVLIEDTAARCQSSSTDSTRVDSIDPNDAACIYVTRQSAATDSSIGVSSEVGELAGVPEEGIANTRNYREFVVSVSSSPDNSDIESGFFEVKVTAPNGEVANAQLTLVDPIN